MLHAVLVHQLHNTVVDGVLTVGHNSGNPSAQVRGHHAAVLDERGFGAGGIDVAAPQFVAHRYLDGDIPLALGVEGGDAAAGTDECAVGLFNVLQRTLDTVENIGDNTGAQGRGQGSAGTDDLLTDPQAGGSFIYLDGSAFRADGDYLTDQLLGAHINHLLHRQIGGTLDGHNRSVDGIDQIAAQTISPP